MRKSKLLENEHLFFTYLGFDVEYSISDTDANVELYWWESNILASLA